MSYLTRLINLMHPCRTKVLISFKIICHNANSSETHQQWIADFESWFCYEVIIWFEGDFDEVCFGWDPWWSSLSAPAAPDDGAGFRNILHFHIIIPATYKPVSTSPAQMKHKHLIKQSCRALFLFLKYIWVDKNQYDYNICSDLAITITSYVILVLFICYYYSIY